MQSIESLLEFGFPNGIIEAWKSKIPSLNQLQVDQLMIMAFLRVTIL
jgi:hypothetical protein